MDELSYYGTLFAIALLQIAYYWFIRNDHYTKELTSKQIGQSCKKALVLVGVGEPATPEEANQRLFNELFAQLKELGFIVYRINISAQEKPDVDQTISFNCNTFHLNHKSGEQIEKVVTLVEEELRMKNLKLHAYISLPMSQSASHKSPGEMLKLVHDSLVPAVSLLLSFARIILKDKARIIQIQNSLVDSTFNATKLIRSLESLNYRRPVNVQDNNFIFSQGQNIEVSIGEPGECDEFNHQVSQSFPRTILNRLYDCIEMIFLCSEKDDDESESIEKAVNQDQHVDEKVVKLIKSLVVRTHLQQKRMIIQLQMTSGKL